MKRTTSTLASLATAALALTVLAGCVPGEGSATPPADAAADGSDWSTDTLNLDFATYNPLSLVIKENGWIEEALGDSVKVNWIQSAGSNKANEALRAGVVDFGSTAGSAALLAAANGSPIQTVDLYSQPEWAAVVVGPDSPITGVADLEGKSIAVTKGTDMYFFLLQALPTAGLTLDDVEVQNLQHADGRAALESGAVDAWIGLDPLMAASEAEFGSTLVFRDIDFNTWGFLNARSDFLTEHPDVAQVVIDAYEHARGYAADHQDEVVDSLAEVSGIAPEVATKVITERTVLDIDPVPGEVQRKVLDVVGPIFVESGDVSSQEAVDTALDGLFNTTFIKAADPTRIGSAR